MDPFPRGCAQRSCPKEGGHTPPTRLGFFDGEIQDYCSSAKENVSLVSIAVFSNGFLCQSPWNGPLDKAYEGGRGYWGG